MRYSTVRFSVFVAAAGSLLLAGAPGDAEASDYTPPSGEKLGIGSTFGRWNDGVVPIAYNPAGAPAVFDGANQAYFENLLQEAMAEIEGAAGVDFDYQGTTSALVSTSTDDLVVIAWEDIGGAAGTAGPSFYNCAGIFADGYCRYLDGTVRFNNNGSIDWDTGITEYTDREFKQVAVHELLHLLGIGHSEKQESIMYADPYTNLNHLRPDDIDALRSLYGRPLTESLAGIYVPPADGTPLSNSWIAAFSDFNTPISTIDGTEDPSDFAAMVWFIPNPTTDPSVLLVTDPRGYYYRAPIDDRTCTSGGSCGLVLTFARMEALHTFPGTWTVRVLINDLVVATETVEVTTSPTYNEAPDSYMKTTVLRGQAPLRVDMTLNVTGDDENDLVDATWHLPGTGEINLPSGNFPGGVGSDSRAIALAIPGNDEVYVQVDDDWTRYGSGGNAAGEGFRELYRIELEATDEADDVTTFVDVTGDSVPDLAGFTGTYSGRPQVAVYSGANGSVDSTINFINDGWRGVALGTVRDADQNGAANDPAIALLTDNKTTEKIRVETRRITDKAFLSSIQFLNENWRAIDVVVVDDLNGDGNTGDSAIGVLAERVSDGRIQLQLRNFSNGALISNVVYLNARWSAVAAAVVDRSSMAPAGTLPPLIGVIAENPSNGRRTMQSRVAGSGAFDRNIKFLGAAWNYHDVSVNHDADGDGTNNDPVWQVLATRDVDRVIRVQSRRVTDGALDSQSVILNDTWRGLKFDAALDIDGNSDAEMVFSTLRRSTGARRIHIKDFASNATTLNIAP